MPSFGCNREATHGISDGEQELIEWEMSGCNENDDGDWLSVDRDAGWKPPSLPQVVGVAIEEAVVIVAAEDIVVSFAGISPFCFDSDCGAANSGVGVSAGQTSCGMHNDNKDEWLGDLIFEACIPSRPSLLFVLLPLLLLEMEVTSIASSSTATLLSSLSSICCSGTTFFQMQIFHICYINLKF